MLFHTLSMHSEMILALTAPSFSSLEVPHVDTSTRVWRNHR